MPPEPGLPSPPGRPVHTGPQAPPGPQGALHFWHHVSLDNVADNDADLSARQLAILLTIYLETPPHTIRGLATRLGVTKPVITRALNTMGAMGLCARRRDETDKRNVLVQRTVDGTLFLDRLAENLMKNSHRLTAWSG